MISGCGRGTRHGAVSIKVERVVRNQESHGDGYESEVVYVTEGPRRRGRPRKPTPVMPRARSGELVYVSASRGRAAYTRSRPQPLLPPPPPIRCLVTGITAGEQTIVNIPKPVLPVAVQRTSVLETKIDWPRDLQDLVSNWDHLPERRTRDVVKWFQTVGSRSGQPKTVCEIQDMWSDMLGCWEEKADLALEWLTGSRPTTQPTATVNDELDRRHDVTNMSNVAALLLENVASAPINRAKVLVEAQPNTMLGCCQWSSMADN